MCYCSYLTSHFRGGKISEFVWHHFLNASNGAPFLFDSGRKEILFISRIRDVIDMISDVIDVISDVIEMLRNVIDIIRATFFLFSGFVVRISVSDQIFTSLGGPPLCHNVPWMQNNFGNNKWRVPAWTWMKNSNKVMKFSKMQKKFLRHLKCLNQTQSGRANVLRYDHL